ncbi:hypothetical protein Nepgr_004913 [Nepenthes gracilis]|uniref:Uncharacterized protein n=1 Tax=Nepenthes gracilis TaxID=150966 RepID=A0AAD3XFP6_NEPGR|nr:hypothetical protein Nepgr_004913 [Nepenthes gracilis]
MGATNNPPRATLRKRSTFIAPSVVAVLIVEKLVDDVIEEVETVMEEAKMPLLRKRRIKPPPTLCMLETVAAEVDEGNFNEVLKGDNVEMVIAVEGGVTPMEGSSALISAVPLCFEEVAAHCFGAFMVPWSPQMTVKRKCT